MIITKFWSVRRFPYLEVYAGGPILAWQSGTLIDLHGAVFAGETLRTATLVRVDQIDTHLAPLAYHPLALIVVYLTTEATEPGRTFTVEIRRFPGGGPGGCRLDALASILARASCAWIIGIAARGPHKLWRALARVSIDAVCAGTSVDTWCALAFVTVDYTCEPFKADRALAFKAIKAINTSSPIFAGIGLTLIHVTGTVLARPSRPTQAIIAADILKLLYRYASAVV
jgi:hypothetical protein